MKVLLSFILVLSVSLTHMMAQDSISSLYLKPELRNRFELRDGFQKLASNNSNPAIFVSQRTRLSIGYETSSFKLKFTPQDVRVWGDGQNANTAGFTGDNASLDMFEGYAELNIGGKNWLSIGRQSLSYDNHWLLSDRNWNQNGISSDAIVLKLMQKNIKVHAGASWNTLKEQSSDNYYPNTRYKTLNYLWVNRKSEKSNLSGLHISTGQTKSDTSNILFFKHTSGLFGSTELGDFMANGNAYYQYGKNQTGKKVSSFLLFSEMSYRFSQFIIGGSISYLSGNKTVGNAQENDANFDLIYAARHKLLGFMDYFTNMAVHTKQGGLTDYAINISYKAGKKLSLQNNLHFFSLSQINSATPEKKYLGAENDFTLKYKFSEWGILDIGYLFYNPTNALRIIQNVPNGKMSQFAYIQLSVSPLIKK